MRVFGHPLHPALVHFPIGLLLSASAVDVAWLASLCSDVHLAAVLMAGGLVMGLVAMGAGGVRIRDGSASAPASQPPPPWRSAGPWGAPGVHLRRRDRETYQKR